MASSIRQLGVRDERERNQRTHDVVSRLLLGKLFDFDPDAIPFIARFKTSVANAIRNQSAKQNSRNRLLPTLPILNEPGVGVSPDEIAGRGVPPLDNSLIDEFRSLVGSRLGPLGTAILDLRMNGDETKSLVKSAEYGQPTSYRIKQIVLGIKKLAQEFAQTRDDDKFLRMIAKAMDSEQRTVDRRFGSN